MFECNDCGVMVVVPTRHGLCAQCHRTYVHRGSGRVYVERKPASTVRSISSPGPRKPNDRG